MYHQLSDNNQKTLRCEYMTVINYNFFVMFTCYALFVILYMLTYFSSIVFYKCAQQDDGTSCGYYVMRYMYEVITGYIDCETELHKVSSLILLTYDY